MVISATREDKMAFEARLAEVQPLYIARLAFHPVLLSPTAVAKAAVHIIILNEKEELDTYIPTGTLNVFAIWHCEVLVSRFHRVYHELYAEMRNKSSTSHKCKSRWWSLMSF